MIDSTLLGKLQAVSLPTLGHVLEEGFCGPRIRRLTPARQLVGIATTIRLVDQDAVAIDQALQTLRPGEVLCIQLDDEERRHAPIGAVTRARALARGAAGIVVDGPVTDIADLRRQHKGFVLPVYAEGTTCLTTKRRGTGRSALGEPITVGGVQVHPGDIVLGDENGLVIASSAALTEVVDHALASDAAEPELIARLRNHSPGIAQGFA